MCKILVIEDEQGLRSNICDMLQLEGFEVLQAPDGQVGLEIAFAHHPDIILCDLTMPNVNGYQFLTRLRAKTDFADIPVILITGRTERKYLRHGMELGADDFLTKPFSDRELLGAVNARLERQETLTYSNTVALEKARRAMVRMVTHELQTPLSSLMMVQKIIERQAGSISHDQMLDFIDSLRSGSQRLYHVVEQIVFMMQIENELLTTKVIERDGVETDLWDLMTASINQARNFAFRNRSGEIILNGRDDYAPLYVYVPALKHALAELITNALNFSPEDSQIVISVWNADGQAWINMVDQGPGIPQKALDRAQQDFEQINRETGEQQGIGLGLWLSRRLVELHGGTMEINSVLDKGTQIVIGLPLVVYESE